MGKAAPTLEEVMEVVHDFHGRRENRFAKNALLMLKDVDMAKVALAWSNHDPDWTQPLTPINNEPHIPWQTRPKRALFWAWRGVTFDRDALAVSANLPVATTLARFKVLRDAQLIFPDGSLSEWAEKTLEQMVKTLLKRAGS